MLRAEIPEPPTLFYGRVVNRTSGQLHILTNGTLVWKIAPVAGGSPVTFTTTLHAHPNDALSYQLKIPHSALLMGAAALPGTVPLTQGGVDYQHVEITVDGFPARLIDDSGDPLRLTQATRATACRLDLELFNPLADSDGDGLPDWWENLYGLNKSFAGDGGMDPDQDGASNLREFRDGSDPNSANTSPRLVTDRVAALERAAVGIRLQTLDSDSQPTSIQYTLLRAPVGGNLSLRSDAVQKLAANDTFTQADADTGKLIFQHEDVSLTQTSFELLVRDENPEHAAATGTVTVVVLPVTAAVPSKVALWLDANRAAAVGGPVWADLSGNHFDARQSGAAPVFEDDSPGANRSVRMLGDSWDIVGTDAAGAFPQGDRTVFAAFKADGPGRQQALGDTQFELGVTADDDPIRPAQLRYATTDLALYSPQQVRGKWVLATAWQENNEAHLELNGLWCAGPIPRAEPTALANVPSVGGKIVGQYDPASQTWQFQPSEQLLGQVGEILIFKRALSAAERRQITHHLLAKWFGYVLWDASAEARPITITVPSSGLTPTQYTSFVATHGHDSCNILLGGTAADDLQGGMEADILIGGRGSDRLRGGGGGDTFVISTGDGNDTIADFRAGESDVIELSDLLAGTSRNLADYVQLSTAGTNSWLRVNTSGAGIGFTNAEIVLLNNVLRQSNLDALWANGNIVARGIGVIGPASINIAATVPEAREEDSAPGQFTLSRSGSIENALTVHLSIGGPALNNIDYSFIGPDVTFAPGQSVQKISIHPYTDNLVEGPEVVEITLLAGTGYVIGTASRAHVTIADLPERISIEALEPVASRSAGSPGYFLVNRSGVLDRSTVVRLGLAGTAVNGSDYQYVSPVLVLGSGQSSALIPITPNTAQPPISSPKLVELRLLPDPNSIYLPGNSTTGSVWLVEEALNLALWRARSLPPTNTDLLVLAGQDPDHDGLVNLVEYWLGSNPSVADLIEAKNLMPRARLLNGHLAVQFKRRTAAKDLQYVVEVSNDLLHWQSGPACLDEIQPPDFPTDPEITCFRDRTPSTSATQRFIRVRVQLHP